MKSSDGLKDSVYFKYGGNHKARTWGDAVSPLEGSEHVFVSSLDGLLRFQWPSLFVLRPRGVVLFGFEPEPLLVFAFVSSDGAVSGADRGIADHRRVSPVESKKGIVLFLVSFAALFWIEFLFQNIGHRMVPGIGSVRRRRLRLMLRIMERIESISIDLIDHSPHALGHHS